MDALVIGRRYTLTWQGRMYRHLRFTGHDRGYGARGTWISGPAFEGPDGRRYLVASWQAVQLEAEPPWPETPVVIDGTCQTVS